MNDCGMNDPTDIPGVDPRNRLNDLTGREWIYALRSVISTRYPTRGPESYAHELRRAHPSPKPPQLLAELVRFFTRRGGHVLDPFAGVGGTLIACSLEGRTAVGVDLSPEYAGIYQAVCERIGIAPQPYLVADARELARLEEVRARPFDLILTDPPYAAMQAREKTGERKKRGASAPTPSPPPPPIWGTWTTGSSCASCAGSWKARSRCSSPGAIWCSSPRTCNRPPSITICCTPTLWPPWVRRRDWSSAGIVSGTTRASICIRLAIPSLLWPIRCISLF